MVIYIRLFYVNFIAFSLVNFFKLILFLKGHWQAIFFSWSYSEKYSFRDPIPKRALKTFSVKTKVSKADKNTILKADRHLFARLIAQSRQLNMRDVLRHELGQIPWYIALSSIIEKGSEHNGVLLNQSVWIFDAMALIQSMKNIPWTFEHLATVVLDSIIKEAQGSRRPVFIKDMYRQTGEILTKLQDYHSLVRINGKTILELWK